MWTKIHQHRFVLAHAATEAGRTTDTRCIPEAIPIHSPSRLDRNRFDTATCLPKAMGHDFAGDNGTVSSRVESRCKRIEEWSRCGAPAWGSRP